MNKSVHIFQKVAPRFNSDIKRSSEYSQYDSPGVYFMERLYHDVDLIINDVPIISTEYGTVPLVDVVHGVCRCLCALPVARSDYYDYWDDDWQIYFHMISGSSVRIESTYTDREVIVDLEQFKDAWLVAADEMLDSARRFIINNPDAAHHLRYLNEGLRVRIDL